MDGKSIMGILLLAAARGTTITITADGPDERATRSRRSAALVESGLRRGRMQRLTGIGVSPGVVSGRAVILIQRAQVLRYQLAPARLEHELARLETSRARAARAAGRHPRAWRSGGAAASWRRSSTRSC